MGSIVKKITKYFNGDSKKDLTSFIGQMMYSLDFDKSSKEDVEQAIIIIMENTNSGNYQWIKDSFILDRYYDLFIKNFSKIHFDNNYRFFYYVINYLEPHKIDSSSFNVLISEVLKCDVILTEKEITSLYGYARRHKIEFTDDIYKKLLCSNNTCNGTLYFIYDNSMKHMRLIYENIDSILNCDVNLDRLKMMAFKEKDVCDKVNKKIDSNVKDYTISLLKDTYCRYTNNYLIWDDKDFNNVLEVIYLILEDIAKNENVSLSSLSVLGSGSYSFVLGLGDKVIKIGKDRGSMSFNNNPYVNAILLRKVLPVNSKMSLLVEVNERLDTKSYVSDEELYQLYKKLRDIGLIWTDVSRWNVGRLLKDNVIHWKRELKPTSSVLGLDEYRGNEVLKKGDIVVLDNDYIFDEKTISSEMIKMGRDNSIFYDRYEEEKRSGKTK